MENPRLRPVEMFPVENGGETLICLRDPEGIASQVIAVNAATGWLLQFCDGKHSLRDMQNSIARQSGQIVPIDDLDHLFQQLDSQLFLDSPHFVAARTAMIEEFNRTPMRESALAGQSYPAAAAELAALLDSFVAPQPAWGQESTPGIGALVVPHIDLNRGGPCYGAGYRELIAAGGADVYVILGIAHNGIRFPYAATDKSFATPLGEVAADEVFLERLHDSMGDILFAEQFAHRREHSVEFQVVFLQHFMGRRPFTIVPVLCGGFHQAVFNGGTPDSLEGVSEFVGALRDAVAADERRICVIVSVDFAHMGGRFGGTEQMTPEFLAGLDGEDRHALQLAADLAPDAFFRSATDGMDRRHIDAVPALWTALRALDLAPGRLLDYRQSVEAETSSVVSFASMAFPRAIRTRNESAA